MKLKPEPMRYMDIGPKWDDQSLKLIVRFVAIPPQCICGRWRGVGVDAHVEQN
jgi:hypothetical protein